MWNGIFPSNSFSFWAGASFHGQFWLCRHSRTLREFFENGISIVYCRWRVNNIIPCEDAGRNICHVSKDELIEIYELHNKFSSRKQMQSRLIEQERSNACWNALLTSQTRKFSFCSLQVLALERYRSFRMAHPLVVVFFLPFWSSPEVFKATSTVTLWVSSPLHGMHAQHKNQTENRPKMFRKWI